MFHIHSDSNLT